MESYELIDHTADIGIRVAAKDLKGLFVNAAYAMFNIIVEQSKPPRSAEKKEMKINLQGQSREDLLVRWLSELLSLSDSRDLFFTDFKISELAETLLKGSAVGIERE